MTMVMMAVTMVMWYDGYAGGTDATGGDGDEDGDGGDDWLWVLMI